MLEQDRVAACRFNDGFSHVVGRSGREHASDDVFVAVLVQHTSVRVAAQVVHDVHHLVERDVEVFHADRVEQNLVFPDFAADDGDLRYAAGGEQARADVPVCDGP